MEMLPNANHPTFRDSSFTQVNGNQFVICSPCTCVQPEAASNSQLLSFPLPSLPPQSNQFDSYTGSSWRAADALHDNIPLFLEKPPDLPPACVISGLLDIYYKYVHPMFPLLPLRPALDAWIDNVSSHSTSMHTKRELQKEEADADLALLFSLCAYTGQLATSSAINILSDIDNSPKLIGDAADLWYEETITLMAQRLRNYRSLEVIQALLLCAMRSQGKGDANQAWEFLGRAVRMGQALDFHRYSIPNQQAESLRARVWGVTFLLDLFLSLQLGRPFAIYSFPTTSAILDADYNLFSYSLSLCRIISRISRCLYPNGDPNKRPRRKVLLHFKVKLNQWNKALPDRFRILNEHPTREVLELHMLYQFALIILFRHCSERRILRATSTFDMFLFQYITSSYLPLSNPYLICLITSAAAADISGGQWRRNISTRFNLWDCLYAFKTIGRTWDLAERCWRQLDSWMEVHMAQPGRDSTSDAMLFDFKFDLC